MEISLNIKSKKTPSFNRTRLIVGRSNKIILPKNKITIYKTFLNDQFKYHFSKTEKINENL